MNLISNKLHRLYLVITLLLVIPDTFYWYTLNDYSNYQDAFTAITSSTGLTWLIVSYLALFFAIFAQNLEMRSFLTVAAFVTRIFFLVWLTDIWRSNEVGFTQVLKNVFVMYSMMFRTKLNGAKYHFAPNGADRSSCTNPPRPFTLKL